MACPLHAGPVKRPRPFPVSCFPTVCSGGERLRRGACEQGTRRWVAAGEIFVRDTAFFDSPPSQPHLDTLRDLTAKCKIRAAKLQITGNEGLSASRFAGRRFKHRAQSLSRSAAQDSEVRLRD